MYAVVTGIETFGVLTAVSVRRTQPSYLCTDLTGCGTATAMDGANVRLFVGGLCAGRSSRRVHESDYALCPQGRNRMRLYHRVHNAYHPIE